MFDNIPLVSIGSPSPRYPPQFCSPKEGLCGSVGEHVSCRHKVSGLVPGPSNSKLPKLTSVWEELPLPRMQLPIRAGDAELSRAGLCLSKKAILSSLDQSSASRGNSFTCLLRGQGRAKGGEERKNYTIVQPASLEQLSKIKFRFIVGQHCFHTYIKQAKKKINSNFIDKKREKKKRKPLFIFGHLIQTNYLWYSYSTYTKELLECSE